METINITPENFRQALAWMNGQASTLGENEVLDILRTLTGRFQENCRALRPGPVALFRNLRVSPHPLSLSAIYAETEERVKKEAEEKLAVKEPDEISLSAPAFSTLPDVRRFFEYGEVFLYLQKTVTL